MRERERLEKHCKHCGNKIPNMNTYCNNTCQQDYQYNINVTEWLAGRKDGRRGKTLTANYIRRYLFEKNNSKCSCCGWGTINEYTGNVPLELNHIDGQHTNNRPENLELLCPNCHSLTPTFRNTGGRKSTRVDR